MEEILMQSQVPAMDKGDNVVLDIEGLAQPPDKCSGSPKMTRALSRKGSNRMERWSGEEQDIDEAPRKIVVKVVSSQLDQLKQPLMPNKALIAKTETNSSNLTESGDGRTKRFNRLTIHPRKVLLLFATIKMLLSEYVSLDLLIQSYGNLIYASTKYLQV